MVDEETHGYGPSTGIIKRLLAEGSSTNRGRGRSPCFVVMADAVVKRRRGSNL